MAIILIILASVALLTLFIVLVVAGGRAHDRQNSRRKNDR